MQAIIIEVKMLKSQVTWQQAGSEASHIRLLASSTLQGM